MIYSIKPSGLTTWVVTNSRGQGFTVDLRKPDAEEMANRFNRFKRVKGWRDIQIRELTEPKSTKNHE